MTRTCPHVTIISNNMKTIDVEQILSPDLKSRMRAQDLRQLIVNSETDAVELDFRGVKFATRSFIDEFYNLFFPASTPEVSFKDAREFLNFLSTSVL